MSRKSFLILFGTILFIAFLLKIIPLRDNNFYFTMDQGNDAVHIREILVRHKIFLSGSQTGIEGLYAGPLWYYFIGLGYLFFDGHPIGAIFPLILLNLSLTGILMWQFAKNVSKPASLLAGGALQIFWPFHDTSRYGFNPFPLVFLSLTMILLLINSFKKGKERFFILAAIPVGLSFHAETAGAMALLLFYLSIGGWFIFHRHHYWKRFVTSLIIIFLFFIPHLISEIFSNFSQTHAFLNNITGAGGVFGGTRFKFMTPKFLEMMRDSLIPQNLIFSLGLFLIIILLLPIFRKINDFTKRFFYLSFTLFGVSCLWFSSNQGWQTWQTVYLPPMIFIAVLLMLFSLPRKIGGAILLIILVSQLALFKDRYQEYFNPSADQSLLKNEIGAIDWVYQKSNGRGFYVYSYLPSVYDYPYQYLFWWYGKKTYGYLPCEYATYPGSPKIFVPEAEHYLEPKKECSLSRFLIIEPDKNNLLRQQWLENTRQGTEFIEQANIGRIQVEKRQLINF